MFQIFAAFAEFESNLNSERTIGGMKARKACGVHLGRPPKLSDADVQAVHKMLASPEITIATVANVFAVSPNTIKRAIRRLEDVAA